MTRLQALEEILETLASCESYTDALGVLKAIDNMSTFGHLKPLLRSEYPKAPGGKDGDS